MSKKVTIQMLAEYTGLSPATISRVFNHSNLVKESTRRQVEEAMTALGMPPAPAAAQKETLKPTIILNIPDIENNYYQKIISGATVSAKAHNCNVLVYESSLRSKRLYDFIDMLQNVQASGVITLNHLTVEALHKINNTVPVVQCSEYNPEANIPYVTINNYQSARYATEYLISTGRNKIAFLNGPLNFRYALERRRGFVSAMENAGLSVPNNWIVQLPKINFDMAYASACQLLDADVIPNAFFAISDILAAAAIRAARQFQLRVPEDISVIGFDNIDISMMTTPSITTVSQPCFQIGYTACDMLIDLISNPSTVSKTILLNTELIVRESTVSLSARRY